MVKSEKKHLDPFILHLLPFTKRRYRMSQITKDMTFAQVMRMHPDVVKVFAKYNLGCIGCMGAQAESLEQGCSAHGLKVDDVLKDLNQLFV